MPNLSEATPFVILQVSARRLAVAKLNSYRSRGSFQFFDLGDERFSDFSEAAFSARNQTIDHLIKRLGDTPASDKEALKLHSMQLEEGLAEFGRLIDGERQERAREALDNVSRLITVLEDIEQEGGGHES